MLLKREGEKKNKFESEKHETTILAYVWANNYGQYSWFR